MLTTEQIEQFETLGAVTIDTPLTEKELADAREAYDHLFPAADSEAVSKHSRHARTADFFDSPLLNIIQHPFFEEVSRQALNADEIIFNNIGISKIFPRPDEEFTFQQHTDVQYSLADLDGRPKQMICSFFLWLADVNEKRAPLMYRPRSHRQIAEWRSADPELSGAAPHVKGEVFENLPDLPYEAPRPIVARAGQASVLTTALIHGPSSNVDTESRYACHLSYKPKGFKLPLSTGKHEARDNYVEALKDHLRADRLHLVDDV
jgi:hypothetical protein